MRYFAFFEQLDWYLGMKKDENDEECVKSKFENVYAGQELTWQQIFLVIILRKILVQLALKQWFWCWQKRGCYEQH